MLIYIVAENVDRGYHVMRAFGSQSLAEAFLAEQDLLRPYAEHFILTMSVITSLPEVARGEGLSV